MIIYFSVKKYTFNINLILGVNNIAPPFDNLDFTCNAWIWDKYGIRISQRTGTYIDNFSVREIKEYENVLRHECNNKIATYHSTNRVDHTNLLKCNIKIRINLIVELIING